LSATHGIRGTKKLEANTNGTYTAVIEGGSGVHSKAGMARPYPQVREPIAGE
jgi:hypothetical protein